MHAPLSIRSWWLVALALVLGCASSLPMPPEEAPGDTTYRITAGDTIGVRVWKNPELSVDVPVRPDGMISVPLLDDLKAEGLTPQELKQVVGRELSEYISHPDVTIVVLQSGKRVFVIGEVVRSGPIPLVTNLRVLDAISAAGGFGPFANTRKVRIIRKTEDGEITYGFNYNAYVAGDAPGTNILLHPGDTIVVPD